MTASSSSSIREPSGHRALFAAVIRAATTSSAVQLRAAAVAVLMSGK